MIRWALWGVEDEIACAIATRLRGATVAACLEASDIHEKPKLCDAVAFFGRAPLEPTVIERYLGAGLHVLLATESCLPNEVLKALSVIARRENVQLSLVNPDRCLSSRQLIKQQLDAGKLGDVGLVRVHRWEPVATESSLSPRRLPAPLVHDLDLVLWLIGKTPDVVYAIEQTGNQRDDSPGRCVQVHLGFAGGGMALIDFNDRLPPGDGYQSLSVIGSLGAAYADDHQNMQILYRGGQPLAVNAEEGVKQFAALLQEFVDDLQTGRDLSTSVTAWRDVLAVSDAVRRSLESRQAIPSEGR